MHLNSQPAVDLVVRVMPGQAATAGPCPRQGLIEDLKPGSRARPRLHTPPPPPIPKLWGSLLVAGACMLVQFAVSSRACISVMRLSALAQAVRIGALALLCALPWVSQAQIADVDLDDDGLIEIDSLQMLHNMRHNLAGTSYKTSADDTEGNSSGCPDSICRGYELMRDLDFDGDDDGRTWSGNGDDGYVLDSGDNQADYFPVNSSGVGGWMPIGDFNNAFIAVFDGNGHSIRNLAIRGNQTYIGLFGLTGSGAAIRNLGLIDNLADHTGSSNVTIFSGGLVGLQEGGSITASYATGPADGGGGNFDVVGGLVGALVGGSITASYATGPASGGTGNGDVAGGLVGEVSSFGGSIRASYATGAVSGGKGTFNLVGGLVGQQGGGSITASYATGAVSDVGGLSGGGLVGHQALRVSVTESYGFGSATDETEDGTGGSVKPPGVSTAAQLTAATAGSSWNDAGSNTLGAWDFGTDGQIPALNYADYDGDGTPFSCDQFPVDACGTLLPGQEGVSASGPPGSQPPRPGAIIMLTGSARDLTIQSWSWQQLAGVTVNLGGADTVIQTFTMPDTRTPLVFELTATASDSKEYSALITIAPLIAVADADSNGLIEIYSLLDLHNMRYNLAGTSYKTSTDPDGSSSGCPDSICRGYELMRDLDFDGDDDGQTWSGNGDDGYVLDSGDNQADYFPVEDDGTGGWLPIGDGTNPFIATFDGNGHSIRNLAIRRAQEDIGLFGRIDSDAAISNLGLIDNLAEYTGSGNDDPKQIGGLVGLQGGGSITASHATGPAAGGDGNNDYVGGLVGWQSGGSIRASYATGTAAGGDGTEDLVGGLVGRQSGGSITASYATGPAAGGDGNNDYVGGLVGRQEGSLILASYATGAATGGDGSEDAVGGLVGQQRGGSITASYATGAAAGGAGIKDRVGGLVGHQQGDDSMQGGAIRASYATGVVDGGAGDEDHVGGLVGRQFHGVITASYATGAAAAGGDGADAAGRLVGSQNGKSGYRFNHGELWLWRGERGKPRVGRHRQTSWSKGGHSTDRRRRWRHLG